jgi:ankyrin repeat protein
MKLGADVNAANCYEETALIRAAHSNNVALAQVLLNHGATMHSTQDHGQTALCKAVHYGHIFMMETVMLMKRVSQHLITEATPCLWKL